MDFEEFGFHATGSGGSGSGDEKKGASKVTIISSSEGFFTKGLEKKLKELGYETQFVNSDVTEIKNMHKGTELYVLYLQDEIEQESLVYIKDILNEESKKLMIIGEKADYSMLRTHIPETLYYHWFDRPLDMDAFLRMVEKYMEENTGENRKKSILIVDDDITYMRLVHDWLRESYRVGMATSGMQAIKWLAKNEADLVLLDYEMPVTSGPQVLEMLKSDSDTGGIPVMFLTGKSDKESLMSVVGLKPVDYLLKNIDKITLLAKLERFFRQKEMEQHMSYK